MTHTRAVWRGVDAEWEFSYSRQLTAEERDELELPEEEPETDFSGDWERAESVG